MNMLQQVEAMAAKSRSKAEENRRRMPKTAEVVDTFRDAFGADSVRVIWAKENGIEVGRLCNDA